MNLTFDWHYQYGKPIASGTIRQEMADFQVTEILPFSPEGEGEHHYLFIEKVGQNTDYVARQLAKFAGIPYKDVSVAGQKDKFAITKQWFCLRIPGLETPDWKSADIEGVTVLEATRHRKKLRTGALLGNQFKLTIRDVSEPEALLERLGQLDKQGFVVPNYYGEQRFGHGGNNVLKALELFSGKRVNDRQKRSIYLSAARSYLFNHVLSARLKEKPGVRLSGDSVLLGRSNSFFSTAWPTEDIQRLESGDLHLSAPLWGRGELTSEGEAKQFEESVLKDFPELKEGLEHCGLKQERKLLWLKPERVKYQLDNNTLTLEFMLPKGCFATSVLRELIQYQNAKAVHVEGESTAAHSSSEQANESVKPLNILISNDDGVHAKGIAALTQALQQKHNTTTIAPDRNCSGASNSITLINPLRVQKVENGFYSVNGTPADCVHFGVRELTDQEPDIVVAGINHGANLGDDTIYSGTVAAAMEGRFLGKPAIAVSLVGETHFDTAAKVVAELVDKLNRFPLSQDQILNVNVPDLPYEQLKGIKVTELGHRHKADSMVKTNDPAGRDIFWLSGLPQPKHASEGTDFHAIAEGYVSITPLWIDLTAQHKLKELNDWIGN